MSGSIMRSIQQVLKELPADLEKGLNSDGVAQSFVKFGGNRLTPLPKEPLWKKFLEKFDEPIIKILLAAALLSMVVDLFQPPVNGTRYTLGAIVVGLSLAAVVGAFVLKRKEWIPSILFV